MYPIDANTTCSYIELDRANGRSGKALYLSEDFVRKQQQFCHYLCLLQQKATTLKYYAKDYMKVDSVNANVVSKAPMSKENALIGFLQGLCQAIVSQLIVMPHLRQAIEHNMIRAHIRYWNGIENKKEDICSEFYEQLCCSFGDNDPEFVSEYARPIPWKGSLIEASFKAQKPLIYNINREDSYVPSGKRWRNFITIIPAFSGNIWRSLDGTKTRPLLTMGISCKTFETNDLLWLCSFSKIDEILGRIIEDYISSETISMHDLVKYIVGLAKEDVSLEGEKKENGSSATNN